MSWDISPCTPRTPIGSELATPIAGDSGTLAAPPNTWLGRWAHVDAWTVSEDRRAAVSRL